MTGNIAVAAALFLALILLAATPLDAKQPSLPGGEGYGAGTVGGRGGNLLVIMTTQDGDYEGTLRRALTRPHPRIVVFGVAGYSDLTRGNLIVEGDKLDNVTLAGQTAPG